MSQSASSFLMSLEALTLANGLDGRALGVRLAAMAAGAPDPERALRNLQRIVEAGFATSLLKDFVSHPILLDVTFELVGQSEYLADIIVRDPQLLRWLTATDVLTTAKSADALEAEARASMDLFERPERRLDALRRFHRREMLRIGAREILREATVEAVTAELSALADVCARCVTRQAHADLNSRLGTDLPNRMAVVALGKLGGEELNFSSDIDLLFVYDEDGDLSRDAGRVHTWHEYHARLAEAVVRGLSEFSGEGHLYRVDMRLRPDGRSGPLAMSRSAMMTYYESRGAAWERQMLLKARTIAGASDVGERFLHDLRPFVFPRSAMAEPWSEIAKMKEAIERDSDVAGNIKLGAGGIRDIEFLVQGLQLLFAGQDALLRTGHTLRALDRLVAAGHVGSDEGRQLRDSYMMFRSVEHRLQLLHGHQTHQLPETKEESTTLGRKLGFAGAEAFLAELSDRRDFVRKQFDAFVRPSIDRPPTESAPSGVLTSALVQSGLPPELREVAGQRLSTLLGEGASRRVMEIALAHDRHRPWLIKAAVLSPPVIERLGREPLLLESLLGSADALLRRSAAGWAELQARDLPRYKEYNETRSIVRFFLGSLDVFGLEREMTDLGEDVLRTAIRTVEIDQKGLGLFALGKLGGGEMGVGSDLDLLLAFDERQCERTEAESAARAIAREFSTASLLYRADFRLRPEGRNAPLAVELSYLASYLRDRAEPWESMALTRARLVWGDRSVGTKARRIFRSRMSKHPGISATYLRSMRRSMELQRVRPGTIDLKVSPGGIVDIEFVAQALAVRHKELLGLGTHAVLRKSSTNGWIPKRIAGSLLDGLAMMRWVETLVRLRSLNPDSVLPPEPLDLRSIALGMDLTSEKDLLRLVRSRMKENRANFRHALTTIFGSSRGKR